MPIGVGPCGVCESRASAKARLGGSSVLVVHEQRVLPGVGDLDDLRRAVGAHPHAALVLAPKRIGAPCSSRIRFSFSSRTASKAPSL